MCEVGRTVSGQNRARLSLALPRGFEFLQEFPLVESIKIPCTLEHGLETRLNFARVRSLVGSILLGESDLGVRRWQLSGWTYCPINVNGNLTVAVAVIH